MTKKCVILLFILSNLLFMTGCQNLVEDEKEMLLQLNGTWNFSLKYIDKEAVIREFKFDGDNNKGIITVLNNEDLVGVYATYTAQVTENTVQMTWNVTHIKVTDGKVVVRAEFTGNIESLTKMSGTHMGYYDGQEFFSGTWNAVKK